LRRIGEQLREDGLMFHYTVSASATKQEIYKMMFQGEGESDGEFDEEDETKIMKLRMMSKDKLLTQIEKVNAKLANIGLRETEASDQDFQDRIDRLKAAGRHKAHDLELHRDASRASEADIQRCKAVEQTYLDDTTRSRSALERQIEENQRMEAELRQLQGAVRGSVRPARASEPMRVSFNADNPLSFQVSGSISLQ